LQATITLNYANIKTAEAIAKAVSPDNFKVPPNLKVTTIHDDCKVITNITCEGKLATFTATIDDLLFNASTAEKTLQTINNKNKL
jgi:hypothetical protein